MAFTLPVSTSFSISFHVSTYVGDWSIGIVSPCALNAMGQCMSSSSASESHIAARSISQTHIKIDITDIQNTFSSSTLFDHPPSLVIIVGSFPLGRARSTFRRLDHFYHQSPACDHTSGPAPLGPQNSSKRGCSPSWRARSSSNKIRKYHATSGRLALDADSRRVGRRPNCHAQDRRGLEKGGSKV